MAVYFKFRKHPLCRLRIPDFLFGTCICSTCSTRVTLTSLHAGLFVLLLQAQRARSMGAIVYCVGVKDFNQTQVGSAGGYWRCCKCLRKQTQLIFYFLRLFVFLARNYCRHGGSCVSCVGRLPGPQGNHWLGTTHTCIVTQRPTQKDTQNHIRSLN